MKKMAVLGGVVIVLIVVIKIGSIFISPSTKDPTEGQTSTEETFQTVPITPGMTTAAREPVTIEIDNDNGSGNSSGSGETDALETLPVETSESLTPQGSGQASASTTAAGTKAAAATTKAASTTKAAANYTVKDIESKTMYATKSVRVRESASTDSAVAGGLTPGQDVKATGETSNGWIRVSYNGGSAYVSKSYLSTTKPDTAKETTAAKKTTGNSSSNTTKTTKPAQESSAAAPTTAASSDETIAPFPG